MISTNYIKYYLSICLLAFLFTLKINAQVFPYLNASTGNEGQYIVDTDTNIIMFHDNQIEKLDKDLNTVWVKKYSGLSFYSLLLSKTGSIYFIASDTVDYRYSYSLATNNIGKIDNNGNLIWCKSNINEALSFYRLLLNRNNNLIASCDQGLIKFDTIGNMLWYKKIQTNIGQISNTYKLTILEDSSGYYSCALAYSGFESSGIGFFKYSEPLDSFIVESSFNEYPQFWGIEFIGFYKSTYEPSVYYSISAHSKNIRYYSIRKHYKETILWNNQFQYGNIYPYNITSFDEDVNKTILLTISPSNINGFHANYNNSSIKIDSSGNNNGLYTSMLDYSWWPPTALYESSNLKYHPKWKYIYTNVGQNFTKNPLAITILDSSISSNCSNNSVLTLSTNISGPIDFTRFLIGQDITPYSLTDKIVAVSSVLNFSSINNYCNVVSVKELNEFNPSINLYPNPANTILYISGNILKADVFDLNGKKVLSTSNNNIDISLLSCGIYFIKIKTDKGNFSQKFIKE